MSNVYLVSVGSYSDYSIDAVFSTRKKAKKYIDECGKVEEQCYNDVKRIEKYPLDEPRTHTSYIYISMTKDGNTDNEPYIDSGYYQSGLRGGFIGFRSPFGNKEGVLEWCVETDDITRAIKVTNEKRIQILANELWMKKGKVRKLFTNV